MTEAEIQSDQGQAVAVAKEYHEISLLKWFGAYFVMLAGCVIAMIVLLQEQPLSLDSWKAFQDSVIAASPAVKLLVFAIYISACCTFLPMNTSWIVSAVSIQSVAVTGEMWSTVLLVSLVGAGASTVANLNDYHIFTLLMRSHHIAKVKHTKTYDVAIRWFEKTPFSLLMIFNILPIPVDVVRPLAASHRYSRIRFAIANFIGRFGRYAVISSVTYMLGKQGWFAVVALLGLAVVLALPRLIKKIIKRA
jgi:membrane protein YqaA with SNARE-associated domain